MARCVRKPHRLKPKGYITIGASVLLMALGVLGLINTLLQGNRHLEALSLLIYFMLLAGGGITLIFVRKTAIPEQDHTATDVVDLPMEAPSAVLSGKLVLLGWLCILFAVGVLLVATGVITAAVFLGSLEGDVFDNSSFIFFALGVGLALLSLPVVTYTVRRLRLHRKAQKAARQ